MSRTIDDGCDCVKTQFYVFSKIMKVKILKHGDIYHKTAMKNY